MHPFKAMNGIVRMKMERFLRSGISGRSGKMLAAAREESALCQSFASLSRTLQYGRQEEMEDVKLIK